MKKTFPEKNVPLSPLLLAPFHISREKKTLTSTPSLSIVKKRRKKIKLHPFKFPCHTMKTL